jgi:hypothetical protein
MKARGKCWKNIILFVYIEELKLKLIYNKLEYL